MKLQDFLDSIINVQYQVKAGSATKYARKGLIGKPSYFQSQDNFYLTILTYKDHDFSKTSLDRLFLQEIDEKYRHMDVVSIDRISINGRTINGTQLLDFNYDITLKKVE